MVVEASDIPLLILPLFLQIFIFLIAIIFDSYISKRNKKIFFLIIALIILLISQNLVECYFEINSLIYPRTLASICGYILRPIILVLFSYIVAKNCKYRSIAWLIIIINALIYLTATFSNIVFTIDENNMFIGGPLRFTCHIVSFILLVWLLYLTIKENKGKKISNMIVPFINVILIIASLFADALIPFEKGYSLSCLIIVVVSCSLSYYIWIHLKFVYEHEAALNGEQRMQIMMSQIQPHFLFNTLSTIQALCKADPQKAFYTTEIFGKYLRQNLNSINQTNLVSIDKEIEHTQIYSEIEMIRFENIKVEYDIKNHNIMLPVLTIQPLVENAIKHGVRIRKNGIVLIKTISNETYDEIIVQDNGKGFDVGIINNLDDTHIGVRNVQERIQKMCNGTFEIKSKKDVGTKITIRIPHQKSINQK